MSHTRLEPRYSAGHPERLPELVAELLHPPVDVLVVANGQAAWAAKRATSTVPNRPDERARRRGDRSRREPGPAGRERDGVSNQLEEAGAKRAELMKTLAPRVSRAAVVWTPDNPAAVLGPKLAERFFPSLGITLVPVTFRVTPWTSG